MSSFRSKILDISSIGVADIISSAIAAVFWLYFASVLGPHNYGQITYLLSIAGITAGIAAFGSNQTLMVLSAKKIELEKTIYVLALGFGLLSSAVLFVFSSDFGISIIILGQIMLAIVTSNLLGKKLYSRYARYVITQKILMIVFGLIFYKLFQDRGILIGIGLSYFPFIIEILNNFRNSKIDFKLLKQKKNFILQNFIFSIVATLYSSLDKLIIAPFLGYSILGNYSLGYQFFFMLYTIPLVVQKYVIPHDATGNQNKKLKNIMILFSIILAIIGSLIGPLIISDIFPKFTESVNTIRIMSWAIIPFTINAVIFYPRFWANEKNHNVTISIFSLVVIDVIGILILGSKYGIDGVAYAFVIGHSSGLFASIILNRFELKNHSKETTN